jgi:hypothetical protein
MGYFSALWKTYMEAIPPKLLSCTILFLTKADMRNPMFRAFNTLKAIAKQLTLLLVSVVMLLSLTQTPVMAANSSDAGTRLGAPGTESVRSEDFQAEREQRREWQRRASSVREDEENKPSTLGEKLNVDELAKGYHPEREAAKRSVPTP